MPLGNLNLEGMLNEKHFFNFSETSFGKFLDV